ncbi:MAG: Wzz/FepE/Etk N-terminal domain-containing protein, partial [Bryobacteraceae bacterium]
MDEYNVVPPGESKEIIPLRQRPERNIETGHHAAYWGPPLPGAPGSGGLLEYWHMLRRRKWMLFSIALFGGILGGLAVIPQPSMYLARTTVEVQGMSENFMNLNEVDPQAGAGSYAPTEANIQTQIQIIESAFMRRRVLDRLAREVIPQAIPQSSHIDRLRMRLRVLPGDPMAFTRQAISACAESVKAAPLKGSRVVEIRCESTIAEIAANFLNVLASEYLDEALEARVKSAQRIGKWVGDRLEQAKVKLEESEGRLQDEARKSGVPSNEQIESLADTKLKQLQAELSAIQADRINKQTRNEMAKTAPPETLPDVVDDPKLREYQAR